MTPRPRRVLLVTDWMPAHGGAEAYASWLRDGLQAAGDDVRLLTSSAGTAANGTADFVAWGTDRVAVQSVLQIVNPFAVARARTAVRTFRPDVVLVHLFAYHLSPAILSAFGDVPIVMSVLDYKVICPLGTKLLPTDQLCDGPPGVRCLRSQCLSLPHWLRDQVRYAGIDAAVRRVRHVLACSRYVQNELRAHAIESEHLPLPVRPPSASFARRPAAHPQFVFCGRLSREKGIPLLIRAFARLRTQTPAARLTIVGDGPARVEAQSAVATLGLADTVTFTGWLGPDDVEEYLTDAWALVAPSIWAEPFGLVALEAIVRGVPVIASEVGGFGETVQHEISGLLFRNGDELALTRCLACVAARDVFESASISREVVARAKDAYGIEAHVAQLRAYLARVCSNDAVSRLP